MKSLEKAVIPQISTSSLMLPLVGPLMLLASMTLLFVHFPERGLVFACVAAISLALSWQLTWKGVAISMALLTLGYGYHFSSMDMREAIWHLGMSSALTLGFVATALSREEITERLAHFFPSPDPVKIEESERLAKQAAEQATAIKSLEAQIQTHREAFAQQRDRILSLEQLMDSAREELKSALQEQEQAQRELIQRKASAARSMEQMAEAREEARYLTEELKHQKESETAAIHSLKIALEQREQQGKALQMDLEKAQIELRASRTQAEGQARRAAFLDEEKHAMQRAWELERNDSQKQNEARDAQLNRLARDLEEKNKAVESQTAHLNELKQELEKTLKSAELQTADLNALKSAMEKKDREFEIRTSDLNLELEKRETLIEIGNRDLKEFRTALENKQKELAELTIKSCTLENEKMLAQAALEAARLELVKVQASEVQVELLQQNLAVAEAQKIAHWRAMRTAEGKYQQLREQFEEKSEQLNDARRQRFVAEEQVEKLTRELEEATQWGRAYPEKPLTKHIQRMEREHAISLQVVQKEVDSLHGLIAYLFKGNAG